MLHTYSLVYFSLDFKFIYYVVVYMISKGTTRVKKINDIPTNVNIRIISVIEQNNPLLFDSTTFILFRKDVHTHKRKVC